MLWSLSLPALLAAGASAHTAAFVKGMYCEGGPNPNAYNANSNEVVRPLYNLPKSEWWMQHTSGCLNTPPKKGDSLALPAGGSFTVEIAHNQAFTTLSYNGKFATDWPDGKKYPEDRHGPGNPPECLENDGALHTNNQSMAAGTAWAISYESDLSKVTMENLVVFSVLEHTPWKRIATYEVPKDLPACPPEGCYCAWLWVPTGCGQPNMYMANYKCHVTGSKSKRKLAPAKAPVYCKDDQTKCVKGAKQMIAWNQKEGNNVEVPRRASPGYNLGMGFACGAQNDIFEETSYRR